MRGRVVGLMAVTGLVLGVGLALHAGLALDSTSSTGASTSVVSGSRQGGPPATPSARSSNGFRIRGVVLDARGPVAGARVSASRPEAGQTLSMLPCPPDGRGIPDEEPPRIPDCGARATALILELVGAREGEAPVHAEAVTSENGDFVLEGLPEGAFTLWALGANGAVSRTGVPSGADGVELQLTPGLTLEGVVMGGEAPLSGARLTAVHAEHTRFFDARTGPDGHFRIGPLPEGEYQVAVSAEGWLPGLFSSDVADEPDARLELFRPRRLAGRVLSGGVPAPGIEVLLESWPPPSNGPQRLQTDAEGRFGFESLPSGHHRLTAEKAGRFAVALLEPEAAPPPEVVLNLGDAFLVEGMVRDEDGRPVPEAWVEAVTGSNQPWLLHAVTGQEGRFRLGPAVAGLYEFRLQAPGHLREYGQGEQHLEAGKPVELVMQRAVSIEGTLVDPQGHPLPDILVRIRLPGPLNPRHPYITSARSDAAGRFTLDVSDAGTYVLDISSAAVMAERFEVQAPSEDLRLMLRPGAVVSGTVVDAQGIPVPECTLRLREDDPDGDTTWGVDTDEAGHFKLRGLKPGRYVLKATVWTGGVMRSTSAAVEVRGEEQVEVSLRLATGRTLTGVVVDGAGQPLAGAVVHAVPATGFPGKEAGDFDDTEGVRTGPDGRFTLRHLTAEAYDVTASKEGHSPRGDGPARAEASTSEVRLVLERQGHVRGRLVGPTGAPISRFEVNEEPVKDVGGDFAVPFSESGVVRLAIAAEKLAPLMRAVEVRAGIDVDLGELRMSPGRTVRGQVLDAETSAPVRALVRYADASVDSAPLLSRFWKNLHAGKDGTFELPDVEARPLTLEVLHPGHLPKRVSVDASKNEVTVRLDRGARVTVQVRDDQGRPMDAELDFDRDGGDGLKSLTQDGTDVLSELRAGDYTVRVSLLNGDHRPLFFRPRRVKVPASGEVSLTLTAESGGPTLTLAVRESGVRIRSHWLRPGPASSLTSNDELSRMLAGSMLPVRRTGGPVTFRDVPPGPATLVLIAATPETRIHHEVLDIPASGTLHREVRPRWQVIEDESDGSFVPADRPRP